MITLEQALQLAVVLGRTSLQPDPQPGALVVETSSGLFRSRVDPDAIGWLVGHGPAPYSHDGTGPQRDVWDVTPLTGAKGAHTDLYQRWENAEFRVVPSIWVERLGLQPPEGWRSDFALPAA